MCGECVGYMRTYVGSYIMSTQVYRERQRANAPDPSTPPGHTLMPTAERRKTLDMLKDSECVCVHACVHIYVRVCGGCICWWLSTQCGTSKVVYICSVLITLSSLWKGHLFVQSQVCTLICI